ncbi:MAG: 3-deoxy-D-manno-octulosonic acid transferase [Planctomycetota bacterium]|nr:MAG: 3-deoxy-D-manno-octulosonic acid transferase [Planctomycetota bacterium]
MTTARGPLRVAASHLAYALAVHVVLVLATLPWLVRCLRDPRQARWMLRRFRPLREAVEGPAPIWIHAVSVGEVKAARGLVAALAASVPDIPIVLSTGTATGFETASKQFPDRLVFPAALDLPWVVRALVRRLRPRMQILMELEVWPALMRALDEAQVPQVILNGRVSEGSFRTYRRMAWWLPEWDRLDLVATQNEVYRDRLLALGVPADRVSVTGNLKHDLTDGPERQAVDALAAELGVNGELPVFVAGSTHEGEDLPVVRAWLAAGGGEVSRLLLVPRHLERMREIERGLRKLGVPAQRRSELHAGAASVDPGSVLLVDSMGELETLFGLADLVFLGGSLVPVGGHNVLEPAASGCPQLVGPHLESCRKDAECLAQEGALRVVADEAALGRELLALLHDPEERSRMGKAAAQALSKLRGATRQNLELMRQAGLLT